MSDHYPCLLSYSLYHDKVYGEPMYLEKRKLTDDALLKIRQYLLFHDWSPVILLSVDDAYQLLVLQIMYAMDLYAPKKMVKNKTG